MYAVNICEMNVGLMQGKYLVEIGDSVALVPGDEKHAEVQEAIRRKWIKVQTTKPETAKKEPQFELTKPPVLGSTTLPKPEKKKAKE